MAPAMILLLSGLVNLLMPDLEWSFIRFDINQIIYFVDNDNNGINNNNRRYNVGVAVVMIIVLTLVLAKTYLCVCRKSKNN